MIKYPRLSFILVAAGMTAAMYFESKNRWIVGFYILLASVLIYRQLRPYRPTQWDSKKISRHVALWLYVAASFVIARHMPEELYWAVWTDWYFLGILWLANMALLASEYFAFKSERVAGVGDSDEASGRLYVARQEQESG